MSVSNPRVPVLYGLPKTQKPGKKMRSIASNISARTYKLSKSLVHIFIVLPQPKGLYVKNTFEFVDKLKIKDDKMMVSYDVTSLYPNIPIKEGLGEIKSWLGACDLLKSEIHCLMQPKFRCTAIILSLTVHSSS